MKVTYRDGIFIAVGTLEENHAPKKAGFSLHPGLDECKQGPATCKACRVKFKKGWWTKRPEAAVRLSAHADEFARRALAEHMKRVEMSRATDADIEIPHPPNFDYYPYQRAGIAFMANPRPGVEGILLGDEMGLGKTPMAIGVVNYIKTIRNVLVVCPAALRPNWLIEARRWLVKDERRWNFHVVDEDEPISEAVNFVIANYNRVTIGYKMCPGPCKGEKKKALMCPACNGTGDGPSRPLVCSMCSGKKTINCPECKGRGRMASVNIKLYESLLARQWDILVTDECHFIKNADAARSRAILGYPAKRKQGLVDVSKMKIFLTGTPIPNRPVELWPVLSICAPKEFGNFKNYTRRYCAAHEEWVTKTKKVIKVDGASNLEEFQERLRSTCMLRRLKRDVLKDLPPKTRQIIALPPTEDAKRLIAEELDIWQVKFGNDLEIAQEVLSASEGAKDPLYEQAAQKLKYIQAVAFIQMAEIRKKVALAKLPAVIDHLKRMWDQGVNKIVCFAHHKEVIRGLAEAFGSKAVLLYGDTKGGADPDNPKNERQQAINRFQKDPTVKLFIGGMLAAGTGITLTASSHVVFAELDWTPSNVTQAEDRCHRLGQKNNVHVQHLILDGSLDARMVQMLVEKQEIADRSLDKSTDVAVKSILEVRPEAPVEPVPVWKKILLKEAMVALAQRRDPKVEGSHGFSSFDAPIGQRLATLKFEFSDKQAHLAIKFTKRYRRQLDDDLQRRLGIYEAPTPIEMAKAKKRAMVAATMAAKAEQNLAKKTPSLNLFEQIQRKARA